MYFLFILASLFTNVCIKMRTHCFVLLVAIIYVFNINGKHSITHFSNQILYRLLADV